MSDPSRPHPVDLETWPRRAHFLHYRDRVPCTYSVTVELDVTEFRATLKATGAKTYAAQIWAIATLVNRHAEFRMAVDPSGNPAVWQTVHPCFTVFNPDLETFAAVWVPYDPDFSSFHDRVLEMLDRHRRASSMFPQEEQPENSFDISSLPWTPFTGFNLNIADGRQHYLPIFTIGGYAERGERTLMPLAVQVHHAAADGFHVARLVNELRGLLTTPTWLTRA